MEAFPGWELPVQWDSGERGSVCTCWLLPEGGNMGKVLGDELENIQGQDMKDLSYQANELELDPKRKVGAAK